MEQRPRGDERTGTRLLERKRRPPAIATLQLAIDNVRVFTDKLDTSTIPTSFLLELLLFLLDSVIAGPPTGAGEDARLVYDRAEATSDLPATARYLESLALSVKDPTGMKRSVTADLYTDLDDIDNK